MVSRPRCSEWAAGSSRGVQLPGKCWGFQQRDRILICEHCGSNYPPNSITDMRRRISSLGPVSVLSMSQAPMSVLVANPYMYYSMIDNSPDYKLSRAGGAAVWQVFGQSSMKDKRSPKLPIMYHVLVLILNMVTLRWNWFSITVYHVICGKCTAR